MYHYRKKFKQYKSYPKTIECQFCGPEMSGRQLSDRLQHAWLVKNRTFYDIWEMQDVEDHLMVIPKRHVTQLSELNTDERLEIMQVLADYEVMGYNIYARGVASNRRSQHHQHTHLIKIKNKTPKFLIHIRKPYFLWKI